MSEKLLFMVTHGPDHPEHATVPFVMAGAALASDVEVVLGFQAEGVELMKQGVVDGIHAPGFAPLAELVAQVRELGAKFLVCSPCLKGREITADQLVEGAEIVAGARFVAELTSATNALSY